MILDEKSDPNCAGIEIDTITEDKKHDQREYEGYQVTARIADDLKCFLEAKRLKPTPREGF